MARVIGTSAFGLRAPIFKEGDDLIPAVIEAIKTSGITPRDNDIIAITESVVARTQGNYVTVDEVAEEVRHITNNADTIVVCDPIYSRNRFAIILVGLARGAGKKVVVTMPKIDEKGNVRNNHPITKMNYNEYYENIIQLEGKESEVVDSIEEAINKYANDENVAWIASDIHSRFTTREKLESKVKNVYDLTMFCHDKCEYGLLGSNKSTNNRLKLFPNGEKARSLIIALQGKLMDEFGKHFEIAVYGDGCFHDAPSAAGGSGIFELADPVTCPAYTRGLESSGNEIKIKAFADDQFKDLSGEELTNAIKMEIKKKGDLSGKMASQGTTPRKFYNLVASLADLISASGDKATPFVYIQGYFDNMISE